MWKILCAIYVRLSKEDEDKRAVRVREYPEPESSAGQLRRGAWLGRLPRLLRRGLPGADSLRPDFNRMIAAAREQRFQIVLCKSQSRFTRDMELVEKHLHGLFPHLGYPLHRRGRQCRHRSQGQ